MKNRRFTHPLKSFGAILVSALLIGGCEYLDSALVETPVALEEATEVSMATHVPINAAFCAPRDQNSTQCAQPIQLPTGFVPYKKLGSKPGEGTFSAPGKGGICCGLLAIVDRGQTDVTVSRAWSPHYQNQDSAPPNYHGAYQYGGYWSVGTLPKSQTLYRAQANVCEEYNSLTTFSVCKIKPGTVVVIGRGQSAACKSGKAYPQSSSLQVMIVGNPEDVVWRCSSYAWPPTTRVVK